MDPLSIATGSASLTILCFKISALLYGFLDEAQNVDGSISGLNEEVIGLSRVLDAINKSWKQDPLIASAQTGPDSDLWYSVKASMEDCRKTLEQIHGKLEDVQKSSFLGRGFLRKPVKQIKLNMKSKDISTYQQRIYSYSLAMHGALQAINVCLLLKGNSSQEAIVKVLDGLKAQIGRVENSLKTQASTQLSIADTLTGDETIVSNLHRVAQAAASFHSNASSIMGRRSTVWGGSVIGEPLSQEDFINIQNWIPPPVSDADPFEDPGSRLKSVSAESSSNVKPTPSDDSAILPLTETLNLDYESDIEQDLVNTFEKLAAASCKRNDYRKAENFLEKILSRVAREEDEGAILRAHLQIAYLLGMQGKFLAMRTSLENLSENGSSTLEKSHVYHTLALAYLQTVDFEKSTKACKAAVRCKRRLIGKAASSSYESIALLAHIYDVRQDSEEAEGYRSLLPADYVFTGVLEPMKYMSKNLNCVKGLIESPKKRLTFAINLGTTFTMVAWSYGQELDEGVEVNLWTDWPNQVVWWSGAKIPSVLYYSADQKVLGWGPDCAPALQPTGYPKPGVEKCEWYQLGLSGFKDLVADYKPASLPLGKTVIDVLSDYLKRLLGSIDLSKIDAPDNIGHVHYVLIAPEFVDDTGLRDFRSALALAGIPKILPEASITSGSESTPSSIEEHVSFMDEGRALILSCADELRRNMNIQMGAAILSVKWGGAIVQLFTYEVRNLTPFDLVKYTNITGDACGSLAVTRNFGNILKAKIAKMKLPDGSKIGDRVYFKSIMNFENRILREFKNDGRLWEIDLDLLEPVSFPNADIKESLFYITNEEVLSAFEPIVAYGVQLINDQIKACAKNSLGKPTTAIVVGGAFARSDYIFGELKSRVSLELQDHIIRPVEPETAIVRGALRTMRYRKNPRAQNLHQEAASLTQA